MLLYQIKNKYIESFSYGKKALCYIFYSIIHVVFMLDAFTKYESYMKKNQLPMVLYVRYIKIGNCDKHYFKCFQCFSSFTRKGLD